METQKSLSLIEVIRSNLLPQCDISLTYYKEYSVDIDSITATKSKYKAKSRGKGKKRLWQSGRDDVKLKGIDLSLNICLNEKYIAQICKNKRTLRLVPCV